MKYLVLSHEPWYHPLLELPSSKHKDIHLCRIGTRRRWGDARCRPIGLRLMAGSMALRKIRADPELISYEK